MEAISHLVISSQGKIISLYDLPPLMYKSQVNSQKDEVQTSEYVYFKHMSREVFS